MNTCPIERLVTHSEEHFIDRRAVGPADETFEQLAQRRVNNLVFMDSLLVTLGKKAPTSDQFEHIYEARESLDNVINRIRQAVSGR